jgi:hypothetical protein
MTSSDAALAVKAALRAQTTAQAIRDYTAAQLDVATSQLNAAEQAAVAAQAVLAQALADEAAAGA